MSQTRMSWNESKHVRVLYPHSTQLNVDVQFCESNNGYLAELNTEDKDTRINKYLDHNLYYWIGLNDISQEGTNSEFQTLVVF